MCIVTIPNEWLPLLIMKQREYNSYTKYWKHHINLNKFGTGELLSIFKDARYVLPHHVGYLEECAHI